MLHTVVNGVDQVVKAILKVHYTEEKSLDMPSQFGLKLAVLRENWTCMFKLLKFQVSLFIWQKIGKCIAYDKEPLFPFSHLIQHTRFAFPDTMVDDRYYDKQGL